ncbi:hypothetical protein G9464_20935 [Halostella sp. JP-L12]|uniref:hypothetical protein n=1 Tax=Halostella TaxID=1843185 RepID=UPI0013CE833F|nr:MULTISPECIES: hypothetical protein [Halostella]NHN50038.1 hypothetical protein [Halostella sp. JP-L12]
MNSRKAISSVLAVALALSVISGGAMAAAPTIDTSATDDTTTTTELQTGSTITNFTANASQATVVQYQADSNESKVEIAHNGTGDLVYANSTPETVMWNSTDNDGHFNVSVNHGELADLERGINDNVTIEVTAYNNTNVSSPDNTSFTAYVETDDSYAVEYVSASDVDAGNIVDLSEGESFGAFGVNVSLPYAHAEDYTDLSTTKNVTENTTVVMALGNGSVAQDFSDSVDDTNPLPVAGSSAEAGDRIWTATAMVDGEAVPVYYEEAPDSANTSDTYAVYTEDLGGSSAVQIMNHGATDSVDVDLTGGASFSQAFDVYGISLISPMSLMPVDGLFDALSINNFEATRAAGV